VPQVSPPQHGCPAPPHATHWPPAQATWGAVQVAPCGLWQHAWPAPPQVPQLPVAQTPPMFGHAEPTEVQKSLTQQPPAAHVLARQQACPPSPQRVQTPSPPPVHTLAGSHARPGQQVWPAAPQDWHTPPTQAPVAHASPGQQAAPSPPQSRHTPPTQAPAAHAAPGQQACPRAPQSPLVASLPHAGASNASAATSPKLLSRPVIRALLRSISVGS
jgi:hypothetical protein